MRQFRRHRSGLWLPTERPPLGAYLDPGHPLAKGLVGAWIVNEAGGRTVFDLSGGRNHGTIAGAIWQGKGLYFDGSGDYVRLQNAPINNQSWAGGITVFWFGKTGPSFIDFPQFVSQDNYGTTAGNWVLGLHGSYGYRLRFEGNNGAWRELIPHTGAALAVNTVYKLAVTWDGTTGKGYINGIFEKSATPGAGTLTTGQEIDFAARMQGTQKHTSGHVYAVFIYARPLSAAEIAWLSAEPYAMFEDPQRRFLYSWVQASWTGIVFSNRIPAPGATHILDGTQIKCNVTDNWYTFSEADIKIKVKGIQYTNASPEVSYETIADGKRITWTPPAGYEYGRGETVTVRVDAKNSHNDESYSEWSFTGKFYVSARETEASFVFHSPGERIAALLTMFKQASERATHLSYLFRQASGTQEDAVAQLLFAIRDWWIGTGQCEPTVFVCEMKRTAGEGDANIAEVEVLAGEASANIYGTYLLVTGGDANIQAFQIFVAPAGSGNIQVTIVRQGEGGANIGIPCRIQGEGSGRLFKLEGTVFVRINALPAVIAQALQDAGININA